MKIRLLYFAVIREITEKNHEDMDLDASATVRQLLVRFVEQYPKTEGVIAACRIAVNQDFVPLDHILRPNDEVAFIPPVAGGEKATNLQRPFPPKRTSVRNADFPKPCLSPRSALK